MSILLLHLLIDLVHFVCYLPVNLLVIKPDAVNTRCGCVIYIALLIISMFMHFNFVIKWTGTKLNN